MALKRLSTMKTTSRPQRNSPHPSQNWRGDMKRKESCFHCFTGRREGEGLLRGRTQASPTLATYETHSVTFIHTTSIIPQKHLRAAVFHRGKLLPPPHPTPPKHRNPTRELYSVTQFWYFMYFLLFKLNPMWEGLKSNKTYLLQYGSLKIKYKHRRKSKTTLLQKKINMSPEETSV